MGREIRRVPPNWSHPTEMVIQWVPRVGYRKQLEYVRMHDQSYDEALAEWDAGKARFDAGERPSYVQPGEPYSYEEDDAGPRPSNPAEYRPYNLTEATWFQVFQTVSEGSPVSPPFATLEELSAYLAAYGDFWDQSRSVEAAGYDMDPDSPPYSGWGTQAADAFCRVGHAPSIVVRGGVISGNAGEASLLSA